MLDIKKHLQMITAEADRIFGQAKAAGRALTQTERAEVERLIAKGHEVVDDGKIMDVINGMKAATGTRTSGMFDPHELADFSKAVVAGESARIKATLQLPDAGVPGDYRPGTVGTLSEPFRVRNLFSQERTDAPSVWFRRITTGSAQANTVAEGALKPEASIVAQQVEAPVRKIATFLPVSEEVVDDGGQAFVRTLVDDLTRDLIRVENTQLINGNGTAPNLRGVLQTTGIRPVPGAPTATSTPSSRR
jgi:HK97 family phage major capsid protein